MAIAAALVLSGAGFAGWRAVGLARGYRSACGSNLRMLWVLAGIATERGIPVEDCAVVVSLADGNLMLSAEQAAYVRPTRSRARAFYVGPEPEVMLCFKDPHFEQKWELLLPLAEGRRRLEDIHVPEPSYDWLPDRETLAECPYHHIAVKRDGRVVRTR